MNRFIQFIRQMFEVKTTSAQRTRLSFEHPPSVIYAIGDVHGCMSELRALEAKILEDSKSTEGEKWIIYLGDLIDRGPKSAQVIDHVLSKNKEGFRKFCIAGNHEEEFLTFIDNGCRNKKWLTFGGTETLVSYGLYSAVETGSVTLSSIQSHVPSEHIDFIRNLPVMITVGNFVFVHAGIDPGKKLSEQDEGTLLWSRPNQFDWSKYKGTQTIVHGHTPIDEVLVTKERINIDIGAYARGVLAAVAIRPDRQDVILSR